MTIQQRVSETEYSSALNAPNMDNSEFILLVTGFLEKQNIGDARLKEQLSQIRELHLSGNYPAAIQLIKSICQQKNSPIPESMNQIISAKIPTLKDDPDKDHNRRFFETRFAENLESEVNSSQSFKSVQKLAQTMKKLGSAVPTQIATLNDSNSVLQRVCQFNDNIELGLKGQSPKYQQKDRAEKKPDAPKKATKENVGSANSGIMKSITPNFYDLIVEERDRKPNRVVDRFKVDTAKQGFSTQHGAVPFVNSISGTTYTLVALLNAYMTENRSDPNLQQDVNNIIKTFMAFYIKNGFHSYGEMVEVLKEPAIQKVFADNNVSVDLKFPDAVMNKSYKITEDYTKTTCLKKGMMQEIANPPRGLKHVETRVAVGPELGRVVDNPVKKGPVKVATEPVKVAVEPVKVKSDEDKLKEVLDKAEFTTYPHNPNGKYLIFKNDTDKNAAHELINKLFGQEVTQKHGAQAQASRVARQINTLEVKSEITDFMQKHGVLHQLQVPAKKENQVPQVNTTQAKTTAPTALPPELEALSEIAKKKAAQEHRVAPITSMQPKSIEKIVTKEETLNALLAKGTLTEYASKPGLKYVVFATDEERKQVDALLKEKFNSPDVSRIAGQQGTIEIKGPAIDFVNSLKNPPQEKARNEKITIK